MAKIILTAIAIGSLVLIVGLVLPPLCLAAISAAFSLCTGAEPTAMAQSAVTTTGWWVLYTVFCFISLSCSIWAAGSYIEDELTIV